MQTSNDIDMQEPWYRNPWVWLVIAIPTLTVVGCVITIYLAISNPHILVSGNTAEVAPVTVGNSKIGLQ